MDNQKFIEVQFNSLRREIEASKANLFKTIGFGLAGIPGMYFVAASFDLDFLIAAIPLLVIVIGLLYLSESHAIMRCGRFIREEIEPQVSGGPKWETWLADDKFDRRTVDRFLMYAFFLLCAIYYIATSAMAAKFASTMGQSAVFGVAAFYTGVGLFSCFFLVMNIRLSTTTRQRY